MIEEQEFRRRAESSIEALKRSLIAAEENAEFEVEEQNGVLTVSFDDPPGRFVVTPNTPARQIWISALATSFKLDWSEAAGDFALDKTGEPMRPLVARLINQHLGEEAVQLA